MFPFGSPDALCRLCGGPADRIVEYDITPFMPDWRRSGVDPNVRVLRCRRHGSWVTDPVPSPEVLASQYQIVSHNAFYSDENRAPHKRNLRLVDVMKSHVQPGARVVDVGGGDGSFSIQAAAAGFRATLLEIGTVDQAPLAEAGVSWIQRFGTEHTDRYDAVTLWDVYEHVWPHDTFLAPIRAALKPGGRLLIEVPSPSHLVWPLMALGAISPSPRREATWANVVNFTHVQLMTPSELRATLPGHGFRVVALTTTSELSYKGVEYASRVITFAPAARAVGAIFDHPLTRRCLLGHNKTFVVAEKA